LCNPSKDTITAKFIFDRINIAQTTYNRLNKATAGNFKVALQNTAVDWFNYIKDTECADITRWSSIEPHFIKHYAIEIKTVDKVWNLSKLKHDKKDNLYELKLEVS
jgi:hypothetical protein